MSELSRRLDGLARAAGVALDEGQLSALESYLELLARWNVAINLTSLALDGFPDATLNRLVVEALVASRFIPAEPRRSGGDGRSWFDLGSGGGSPAIPLKIVRPDLLLTLVESKERKSAFLREVVRAIALGDAEVITARIEDLTAVNIDLITVRAVAASRALAGAVGRMLAPTGRLLYFGSDSPQLPGLEPDFEVGLVSPEDRLFVMKRST